MTVRSTMVVLLLAALAGPAAGQVTSPAPRGSKKETAMNLAFILLREARMPRSDAIVRVFASFSLNHEAIRARPADKPPKPGDGDAEVFDLGPHGSVMVALMPVPVPKGEADEAVRYSVSSMTREAKLPRHKAHLVVVQSDTDDVATVESLSRFTTMLAAITEASGAIGVYWGNAGATHEAKFFREMARDRALLARMMLWTGVSVGRETDGRVGLLSLGMKQLKLPDLWLMTDDKVPRGKALEFFFQLLAMVAEGGKPLPEGDTVGRNHDERLPVHYVASPIHPETKVWRVDLH
jgi:hypothetical protein